jgi:hypothetical protein
MKFTNIVDESTPLKSSYATFPSVEEEGDSNDRYEREVMTFSSPAAAVPLFSQSVYSRLSNNHCRNKNYKEKRIFLITLSLFLSFILLYVFVFQSSSLSSSEFFIPSDHLPILHAAWSSKAAPFSTVDPQALGVIGLDRPSVSMPAPVFDGLLKQDIPLPTNAWYENFFLGSPTTDPDGSKVFQVPYIIDIASVIPGVRTHACHVQAFGRQVMMTHELENGFTLGAREKYISNHSFANPIVHPHHQPPFSKLAVELEWSNEEFRSKSLETIEQASGFRVPIVRGSPYTSVLYFNSTPYLYAERVLKGPIIIDQGKKTVYCDPSQTHEDASLGTTVFHVEKEMKMSFDISDITWMIFLSEPMDFTCQSFQPPASTFDPATFTPGVVVPENMETKPFLKVFAMKPVNKGMVRVAMLNNCTTGQSAQCKYYSFSAVFVIFLHLFFVGL